MAEIINASDNRKWYQRKSNIVVIIIVAVIVAFFGMFWSKNNQMVTQKQAVEQQMGQVQTVLQRRADLIPNLVNAVKGQQKQEKDVYQSIANARKNYYGAQNQYNNATTNKQKIAALGQQEKSLNVLVGSVQEAYPKLDSSSQMGQLMTELEGSENRISVERRKYNQAVGAYNNTVLKFPGSLFASMTGNQPMSYFNATTTAQNAPSVNF